MDDAAFTNVSTHRAVTLRVPLNKFKGRTLTFPIFPVLDNSADDSDATNVNPFSPSKWTTMLIRSNASDFSCKVESTYTVQWIPKESN
jgi:hypothetical protein